MPIYLTPVAGEQDEIISLSSKAGIHYANPVTVRDFIIEANEHSHVIFGVTTEILMTLTRHANQLLSEMPSVVLAVPGLIYQADWNIAATAFHTLDYTEIQSKLSKSGLVAHVTEDLEKRNIGTMEEVVKPTSLRQFRENGAKAMAERGRPSQSDLSDPNPYSEEDTPDATFTDDSELPGE